MKTTLRHLFADIPTRSDRYTAANSGDPIRNRPKSRRASSLKNSTSEDSTQKKCSIGREKNAQLSPTQFFAVTIYKCALLGSHGNRQDCSLCLTRDNRYQCSWCGGQCMFGPACMEPVTTSCPPPRIDWVSIFWSIIDVLTKNFIYVSNVLSRRGNFVATLA